ncbi:regulation of protein localization to cell-cell adherens junction [Trichomonas vaginalis G3]|uniref:regulation of protein localization to cell-cell adherens junction n=1 Tax=Trichomonas vaginalis (strain ATCC PRA-98 / G3) TaxID=412133 RepID=UPI0021E59B83|nr:regulation of protein localization to cell-cell adherens junction [Trichomonas vaginalis G3]KAI5523987.1 regulation of protein localization to cell-cell adherens junction [Trichomonas vaginalis G3]
MKFHRTTLQVDINYLPLNAEGIPSFLPIVLEFIHRNVQCEGLFRINGNKSNIKMINESLSQHVPSLPQDSDVYDVAGFLKTWVSELPAPLVDPSLITKFYQNDAVSSTYDILNHLSPVCRKSVASIFYLIRDIINNSGFNKMQYENLEICFFYSFTHVYKSFPKGFNFKTFFIEACGYLNETGTDFELKTNVQVNTLEKPASRAYRSVMTAIQRKHLGVARCVSRFNTDDLEDLENQNTVSITA